MDNPDAERERNEVLLVGRLAAAPVDRTLPSGDAITTFRVIVARAAQTRRHGAASEPAKGGSQVDTLECTAWQASARRAVRSWSPGDVVEISGALRRRFWRSPAGPASRYDVEVGRARRLRRAVP